MPRTAPEMRQLAEWLVKYETQDCISIEAQKQAAFIVFGKLRSQLMTLMGVVGFSALLSRALFLVQNEIPWLQSAVVSGLGNLEGLENLERSVVYEEMVEGAIVLLSQLLDLLRVFVGERLTMNLLYEVWPALSLANGALEKGNENE